MKQAQRRLSLEAVTKRYGTVVANDNISLDVDAGEIHAVLGENGAGKSTLMKIIYGMTMPDQGSIAWNGQAVHLKSPQDARALGISMVFQHFSLFDSLTVAENIALGIPPQDTKGDLAGRIRTIGKHYGLDIEPTRHVHSLSVGERQRVEIIRALLTKPQLLILDEPTSVLTPQAVKKLFGTLRQLACEGCSILYISHKLDEIRELCDRATVMRAGKVIGGCIPAQETSCGLSQMMIGGAVQVLPVHRKHYPDSRVMLSADGLSAADQNDFSVPLDTVSLAVNAGELVGIAGISGNGQNELMALLSGENLHAERAAIQIDGQPVGHLGVRARRGLGLAFVPEERLGRGAVPVASLADNMLLSCHGEPFIRKGIINHAHVRQAAQKIIDQYKVRTAGAAAMAKSLSGGNLQKFLVGREIAKAPAVLLVSQPTWGVDVGAAAQIHEQLLGLRDAGCAILIVSEELDELLVLCDRLYVMAKGRLSPSVDAGQVTKEQIGVWMSGLWDAAPPGVHQTPRRHAHVA